MRNFIRRFLRERRAITPVLSSLLLTVIAVGAMAAATSATFVITTNMKETMSERIVVEDVWFNPSTRTIDVYMSNVGKVNVHVSHVYVNHTDQPFNTPFNLELDGQRWLVIVTNWHSGDIYYIDIVTNRGTHIASYYKAT